MAKWYETTALALSAIGAINWAFDVFGWNLVDKLIGSWAGAMTANVIYIIVALCGVYAIVEAFK